MPLRLSEATELVQLYGKSPLRVLLDQSNAPVEGPRIDSIAFEGRRDPIVIGLDRGGGQGLSVPPNVLHFVGDSLSNGVFGHLWADGHPVQALRQLDRTVGLDGQPVAGLVQRLDQLHIDLEGRFSSGQHHPRAFPCVSPQLGDNLIGGQIRSRLEFGVAVEAMGLDPASQVAFREPQEQARLSYTYPFTLQAEEDLVDSVELHARARPTRAVETAKAGQTLAENREDDQSEDDCQVVQTEGGEKAA